MIQNAPWVTLSEALTAGQMFPLDSKNYDFIRDLMDTYQARPIDRKSFFCTGEYDAFRLSGRRDQREAQGPCPPQRRCCTMNLTEREKEFLNLLHTLTKEQKDEYIRYLQRLVKEDPRQ